MASQATVWVVDADEVEGFAGRVFEVSRIRPLLLVSTSLRHGDRPLVDPARLAEETAGLADVAVLADDTAGWALSNRLGRLGAWGGAVRIYLPDATEADPWERHPLVRVDAHQPAVGLARVMSGVRAAADLSDAAPPSLTVLPAPTAQAPQDIDRDSDRHKAEIARMSAQLAHRDRLLREKDEALADLRQQVRKLTKQLRTERAAGESETPAVYADPERQFRHEVEQHWLATVPEQQRRAQPLGSYRIGRDWLASLDDIELVGRRKVLEVVVEVLTGRAVDSAARRPRRMRTGDAGGTPPRIRADGAMAWRCDVKHGTASAPRLMWWKLPDHTLELGRVAAHDDMQLR